MKQPDACVVRITDSQGEIQGTGFLISTEGLVVTCAHVVKGRSLASRSPAQVVATDETHDVAVLWVPRARRTRRIADVRRFFAEETTTSVE